MSKISRRGAHGAPDKRSKILAERSNDWERVARERVEDDRLRLRGGAALN